MLRPLQRVRLRLRILSRQFIEIPRPHFHSLFQRSFCASSSVGGEGKAAGPMAGEAKEEQKSDSEIKLSILDASLAHVHKKGFSIPALTEGARDCGFASAHVLHGLFENGEMDLLDHLCRKQTAEMVQEMESLDLKNMTPIERIKTAIRRRLKMNVPYMEVWPSAMALGATPKNLGITYNHISHTIDEIWRISMVEDDTDAFAKKTALSGVYVATELFMLSDQSVDYESTWIFLERRLDDVLALQSLPLEIASKGQLGLNLLSSVLQNVGGAAAPSGSSSSYSQEASTATKPAATSTAASTKVPTSGHSRSLHTNAEGVAEKPQKKRKKGVAPPEEIEHFVRTFGDDIIVIDARSRTRTTEYLFKLHFQNETTQFFFFSLRNSDFNLEPGDAKSCGLSFFFLRLPCHWQLFMNFTFTIYFF